MGAVRTTASTYLKPKHFKHCEQGQESELLRDNVAQVRSSVAHLESKCVGMEPDSGFEAHSNQRRLQPPQNKTQVERIREMFGSTDNDVIEGAVKAESGIKAAITTSNSLWPELDDHLQHSEVLLKHCQVLP
jgi:hypothetical protein